MSLAEKIGKSYEQVKEQVKIRRMTVQIGDASFDFKVRIPLKREMDEINARITEPSKEKIDAIFNKLSNPILSTLEDGGETLVEALKQSNQKIEVLEDDLIIDGTSLRNVSTLTAMWETKVEEFFHLLQSEIDEPINENFDQISEEFPEQIVRLIVEEIERAIKPDYKNTKKV